MKYAFRVFVGESEGVDGRALLKCIFKKLFGKAWTGLLRLGVGSSGGFV
jgi:hypothetical protein